MSDCPLGDLCIVEFWGCALDQIEIIMTIQDQRVQRHCCALPLAPLA
jgi:hypothetical protein